MPAFLVNQIQQLCCPLFKAAHKLYHANRSFWEKVRYYFYGYVLNTMEELYYTLLPARRHNHATYTEEVVSLFQRSCLSIENDNRKWLYTSVRKTGFLPYCVQNFTNVSSERADSAIWHISSTKKTTFRWSTMTVRKQLHICQLTHSFWPNKQEKVY